MFQKIFDVSEKEYVENRKNSGGMGKITLKIFVCTYYKARLPPKTGQIHKWECKRDDQTLCTGTTSYSLSTCQEDTRGEIQKSIPCHGRI